MLENRDIEVNHDFYIGKVLNIEKAGFEKKLPAGLPKKEQGIP